MMTTVRTRSQRKLRAPMMSIGLFSLPLVLAGPTLAATTIAAAPPTGAAPSAARRADDGQAAATPAPPSAPARAPQAASPTILVTSFENTSEDRSLYWVGEAI